MSEFNPDEVYEALVPTKKSFPLFQISKFLDKARTYQVVVRADSYSELETAMGQLKPMVEKIEQKQAETSAPIISGLKSICALHNVEMEEKQGQYGPYFSHRAPEGFCNGKKITPFKR